MSARLAGFGNFYLTGVKVDEDVVRSVELTLTSTGPVNLKALFAHVGQVLEVDGSDLTFQRVRRS